jgi:hypothetical protein
MRPDYFRPKARTGWMGLLVKNKVVKKDKKPKTF